MYILVVGSDPHDLLRAFTRAGSRVTQLDGAVTSAALEDAAVETADAMILTAPEEATAIPLARELNPSLFVVVYSERGLPDALGHLADLLIDPEVLAPSVIVEEVQHANDGT